MSKVLETWIASILIGMMLNKAFPQIPAWAFTLGMRITLDVVIWSFRG